MANVKSALDALAIARQSSEFNEAAQHVYADLLSDLEPDFIALACASLAKKPRAEFGSK